MKIIQITPCYPPHLGGMDNVAKELSERLAKKGHQVEVFTSDIGCPKDKQLKSTKNLKINYLPAWEFAHTPIIPSLFWRLMKIPKDSIVCVHSSGEAFVPEIVYLISKIKKISYIIHIHLDVGPTGKFGFLLPFYKKIFLNKILKSSKKIIVPTKDYINIIKNKYSLQEEKITCMSNGIDLKIFKKLKSNWRLHKPIKLLFVGRFSKQKDVPLLIRSFKKLTEKNSGNVKLHIVGDGEEKNKIITLIKKEKLENGIVLHGLKQGKKLHEIYQNSDIFISATNQESFGLTYLEAMASGLPIVTTNIPGVRNVIKNNYNGLLVKPTPEEIAKAIEKLIKDPNLRKKLAENGLKEVKKYSWDKIAKQYIQLYKQILKNDPKK